MLQTILIAFGLSMDAFAVSISSGVCIDGLKFRHAFRASLVFGLFQAIMPLIGWFLGESFRSYIQAFDHWIAFGLLAFVGIRMVKESVAPSPEACEDDQPAADESSRPTPIPVALADTRPKDVRDLKTLLVLGVATSVDALAVGLSFSMLGEPIGKPAAVIGVVTFLVCMGGFEFGRRVGGILEKRAETFGGLVLIAIGVKILVQHLSGGA